jgi:hypothetical protein
MSFVILICLAYYFYPGKFTVFTCLFLLLLVFCGLVWCALLRTAVFFILFRRVLCFVYTGTGTGTVLVRYGTGIPVLVVYGIPVIYPQEATVQF